MKLREDSQRHPHGAPDNSRVGKMHSSSVLPLPTLTIAGALLFRHNGDASGIRFSKTSRSKTKFRYGSEKKTTSRRAL